MALPKIHLWSLAQEIIDYIGGFLSKAGGTMSGDIVLKGDPSSALHPATKQYVDGIAANLGKRARVRAATTANITISTALNNGDALDGVTLATGDQVLVKDQTAPAENGVYIVGVTPARTTEFDSYDEYPGTLLAVQEGTSNADTLWLCTSNKGGTLGTTAIAWSQITAGTSYPSPRVLAKTSGTSVDLSNVEVVTFNYAAPATITAFSNAVTGKVYTFMNIGVSAITIDRTSAYLNGSANQVLDNHDVVQLVAYNSATMWQVAPKSDNG